MSNPDHWNSLASQLGAQIPEQARSSEEKKPAAQALSPPKRPAAPPAAPKPVARREADWSRLASQLGVTTAEPPRAASTPPQPPRARAGGPPEVPAARQRPAPSEVSEPPKRQTEPLPDAAEFIAEEIVSEEPIDAELVEGDDESRSSAFHQEEKERTGRKRRRRRRGGRRSKSGRAFDEEQPRDAAGDAPEAASVAEDAGAEEGVSASAPTIEDRTGRPKRRRRRGSGRNRDKARAQTAEPKAGLETEAEHEGKPFADDDEQADLAAVASEADSFEDEVAESQADKNSHRAIPAWEEAIGYIVSVNMENRAKNPKSGAPRGRGRGRGNRGNPRGDNHRRSS